MSNRKRSQIRSAADTTGNPQRPFRVAPLHSSSHHTHSPHTPLDSRDPNKLDASATGGRDSADNRIEKKTVESKRVGARSSSAQSLDSKCMDQADKSNVAGTVQVARWVADPADPIVALHIYILSTLNKKKHFPTISPFQVTKKDIDNESAQEEQIFPELAAAQSFHVVSNRYVCKHKKIRGVLENFVKLTEPNFTNTSLNVHTW